MDTVISPRPSSPRAGLTLTEVLVVIAIISLLLAVLLPGIASLRDAARTTQCKTNMRQMALAAQRYALDYDVYPPAVRYENPGVFTTIAWDWATTATGEVTPGPLWAYTDDPLHVQQCPAYHGPSTFGADPFTGYNYNTTYLGAEAPFGALGWSSMRPGIPAAVCRRVTTCAMFGDGAWTGGANKFMRAPGNRESGTMSLIYAGGQAFRHGGATNVAWLDGHITSVETAYAGKYATESLLEDLMGHPENGFLSDDDSAYDPR